MGEMIAISNGYGVQTDVWSAGILLYFLFTGEHAFGANLLVEQKIIFTKISTMSHNIAALNERGVVAQAHDLISYMLKKEPAKRPSAKDVLGHSWLNINPQMTSVGRYNMLENVVRNLVDDNKASQFEQGLLNDVVHWHEAEHGLEESGRAFKAARLLGKTISQEDQNSIIESFGKGSSG